MKTVEVNSSTIKSLAYNEEVKELLVTFKNNTTYSYEDVPFTEFEAMIEAESVGKYFSSKIKGNYVYKKVEA